MNEEKLYNIRHSLAHLLATAVLEIWPETKVTIGPVIENGFYYDFDFKEPVSDKNLEKIEIKMKEILKTWTKFERKEVSPEEARNLFADNPYKTELIEDLINKNEQITTYTSGNFTDLCRGGHIDDAKEIKADSFKLSRVAGAYWHGDEKNKMLTRIYGLAFESKEMIDAYLLQQEEAEKRDHRKIGALLKLFTISPLVGSGLPLIQPKGMIIRKEIEDYLWELHKNLGYSRVWTPHIAKEALYETSGHAAKFGDELFRVQGKEEKFFLKPMNCPHHMQIFADNQFSYRDLPIRYFEPATVYRDEKTGQLSGLTRVRSITQDDGHLFCRKTQIGEEIKKIVAVIKEFYTTLGMINDYWVRLSLRGEDKNKYLGSDEVWNIAETALAQICEKENLPFKKAEGEAAFYGPKLDFMFKDAIGREWQLATIQCDFNLPEKFELSFINEEGQKERPVVIHRAVSGSLERFMGVMIEHFAGAFPLWLSPVQVIILPISDEQNDYAEKVFTELKAKNIRVEFNRDNESLGKKIRGAKIQKIPYIIVIGKKEVENNSLTVEGRNDLKLENISLIDFSTRLEEEIKNKNL